jgi:hypothetical protein
MSSLITHLAYGRIERSRLVLTYLAGLGAGAVVAAMVLTLIGAL